MLLILLITALLYIRLVKKDAIDFLCIDLEPRNRTKVFYLFYLSVGSGRFVIWNKSG